jgi:hypothetical protein
VKPDINSSEVHPELVGRRWCTGDSLFSTGQTSPKRKKKKEKEKEVTFESFNHQK